MTVWLFPGQGSQRPAMGGDYRACAELLGRIDPEIAAGLEPMCFDPDAEWPLDLLQPAVFLTTTAAGLAARRAGAVPSAVAGHSLGEYAALVVAEAIDFEDAFTLVMLRSRLMRAAAGVSRPGMWAVLGLPLAEVTAVVAALNGAGESVWLSAVNAPDQVVLSGRPDPVERAAIALRERGARRVTPLKVPIAGHCPLMEPVVGPFQDAIEATDLRPPKVGFYSCVEAQPCATPSAIARALVSSITQPVQFVALVHRLLRDGAEGFAEFGPAAVLSRLVTRIEDVPVRMVGGDDDVHALLGPALPSTADV